MDEMAALLAIGICIFAFLLVLLGIGEFYGGDWQTVAEGVTKFMLLIVGFALGCFALVRLLRR